MVLGLYLSILSLTLLFWLGSPELELVPILLIYGIVFVLAKLFDVLVTVIRLRSTSRAKRIRNNNQAIVDWVILNTFGIDGALKSRSFTHQQHITLNLLRFLLKKPLDRATLQQIHELDCTDLFLVEDIESSLTNEDYTKSLQDMNKLTENYGMNPWIYSRLRKCYLELDDLDGLENLNFSTGSKEKVREVQIRRLAKELQVPDSDKRSILENLYKLAPDYEVYTEQYFRLLQTSNEYELLLRLVRASWRSVNSIQIARMVLEVFNANVSKVKLSDFVNSLPLTDSYGYELLKLHSYLSLGEISKAKTIPNEVIKKSELVGHIFQIELASLTKDTRLLSEAINSILSTKISEKTTMVLND